jgi:MarR family 2-MHQ and catechol resistance regulon transcriptional repressor
MTDRAKLAGEIIESFHAIKNKFVLDGKSFRGDNQITFSQLIVLRIARNHDGINIKDIADRLGVTSSAITQLVDALVRKGYLKREGSPEDRRALKISISEEGMEKISTIRMWGLEKLIAVFDVLNDDELAEYCELNKKIVGEILHR